MSTNQSFQLHQTSKDEDVEPELRAIERLDYVLGALSIQVSKNSAAKQLSYRARHKVAKMAGWQAAMMAALPEQLLVDLPKISIRKISRDTSGRIHGASPYCSFLQQVYYLMMKH